MWNDMDNLKLCNVSCFVYHLSPHLQDVSRTKRDSLKYHSVVLSFYHYVNAPVTKRWKEMVTEWGNGILNSRSVARNSSASSFHINLKYDNNDHHCPSPVHGFTPGLVRYMFFALLVFCVVFSLLSFCALFVFVLCLVCPILPCSLVWWV